MYQCTTWRFDCSKTQRRFNQSTVRKSDDPTNQRFDYSFIVPLYHPTIWIYLTIQRFHHSTIRWQIFEYSTSVLLSQYCCHQCIVVVSEDSKIWRFNNLTIQPSDDLTVFTIGPLYTLTIWRSDDLTIQPFDDDVVTTAAGDPSVNRPHGVIPCSGSYLT